ncbi:MAG: NAD(P)H-dependent oxidoreductase [Saprospiraceae bacterium]|nr:NAD(P)H-dependent oxidoreductase [Saprospiraceae bacterium]
MRKVLVLFFHPRFEDSKANKTIIDKITKISDVLVRDMYELYPDFNIDIKTEQQILASSDVIIWQHPFYWYSSPPLLKQWIDLVLEYGWAYGKNGDKLKGKNFMTSLTSGGTFDVYRKEGKNHFTYRDLLRPFEQTVNLCSAFYLPPFIVPGATNMSDADLDEYGKLFTEVIQGLQNGFSLPDIEYINNLTLSEWKTHFYKTP